jgi:uncharacterized damage-inducible protein DinB
MTRDELVQHLEYTTWASQKLLDAALALSPEEQTRDLGASHASIASTLAHIYFADSVWLSRLNGVSPSSMAEVAADTSLPAVAREWPQLLERFIQWARQLDDESIKRVAEYRMMDGTPGRTPVWQIVLHVVNHGTLHRGQTMAMFRQLGHKPPATDLIYYYRSLI